MTKGEKVEKFLADGYSAKDAARMAGASEGYAYVLQWSGGYQAYLSYNRSRYDMLARAAGVPNGTRKYDYTPDAVVAAINSGMSYSDVARKFGVTRNVVAGCLRRHLQRVDA